MSEESNQTMKWFHAIGACGKATANVAKMFKDMGWFVTGTDLQYLPPASLILEQAEIPFQQGYSFKHLTKEFWEEKLGQKLNIPDKPDLALIVESASNKNKEYLFAKRQGIDVRPYSQILGEYLVKENSIVVTGTAGKTTTTALLVSLLKNLELDPSYMIGAEVLDFSEPLLNTDSNWSVMEGDEYHSLELSNGAKFLEYKPKYGIITNIGWEHQDIFPTRERYIEEFGKFANLITEDGLLVAKANDETIDQVVKDAKCKVIRYQVPSSKFQVPDINCWKIQKKNDNEFIIFDQENNEVLQGSTNLIGKYNLENILASVIMLKTLMPDVKDELLIDSIAKFKGPKKRLEILYKSEGLVVVDDFGVAPDRARNSINTLKENFPDFEITAVFEPNSGSRIKDLETFNNLYKGVFDNAAKVIIPALSEFNDELLTSSEMVERLQKLSLSHFDTSDIKEIKNLLKNSIKDNYKTLIVFFSSYRLDSIAKEFIEDIRSKK